jgi:shikimate kinase
MPVNDENVYLIGFMGAGKSTIGDLLAKSLKRPFSDTDVLIQERCGESITEIFRNRGEAYFRMLERDTLAEVAKIAGQVVAVGGGAMSHEGNRRAVKTSGTSIYLQWRFETLLARIRQAYERPLVTQFRSEFSLRELYERRRPYYEKADYVIACDEQETLQIIVMEIRRVLKGET